MVEAVAGPAEAFGDVGVAGSSDDGDGEAMIRGPEPVRMREASSAKVTSRTVVQAVFDAPVPA